MLSQHKNDQLKKEAKIEFTSFFIFLMYIFAAIEAEF